METKKELSEMTSEDRIKLRDDTAKELNEKLAAMGKQTFNEDRVKRVVGGGTQVGDTFTLTGEVVIGEIQNSKNVYLALATETGEKISIKALIPQSVAGYTSDNSAEFYDELEPNSNDVKISNPTYDAAKDPKAVVTANKKVCNHGTRSDIELYGLISSGVFDVKGFKLTYLGKVYRQTKAAKDYEFGEATVKKGARRAMSVSIWEVKAK
nr:MAG TPA: hypothetical protein [Bacteriophage sp.]